MVAAGSAAIAEVLGVQPAKSLRVRPLPTSFHPAPDQRDNLVIVTHRSLR